jgi:hypothetical protein
MCLLLAETPVMQVRYGPMEFASWYRDPGNNH